MNQALDEALLALALGDLDAGLPSGHPQAEPFLALRRALQVLQDFAASLARGDLSPELKMGGGPAGSLKALQASLRHLAWQARQVATGQFERRVDFLGELSDAFNGMMESLERHRQDSQELIDRLRREAEEHAASQAALKGLREDFRLLAEGANDVVWATDHLLHFTHISAADQLPWGFTPQEVLGKALWLLLPPEGVQRAKDVHLSRLAREKRGEVTGPMRFELPMLHRQGHVVWAQLSSTPRRDALGRIVGYLGTIRDIGRYKEAQDECRRLREELDQAKREIRRLRGLPPE